MKHLIHLSLVASLLLPVVPAYAQCVQDAPEGFKCGWMSEELPETWSAVYHGEVLPSPRPRIQRNGDYIWAGFPEHKHNVYSIGQDTVAYGDTNWNQVDFYMMSGRNLKRYMKTIQKYDKTGAWSTETIDGKKADVWTMDLDNGEVTKGGTGGKYYFVTWTFEDKSYETDGKMHTFEAGMFMHKQALGDDAFESGVKHVLSTIDFDRFNMPLTSYLIK